ncbi:uncharacterized protein TNCV_2126561 [Trichonephila clavipes]|nr:uncharacterized protein TNCV_2126561 [Trichonephila clavipes]
MFSGHNPILRTVCGKVVEAIGRCMLRENLNGVVQTFEFLVFQQCSHDLILGWNFFKVTDDTFLIADPANFRLEKSLQMNEVNSGLYAVKDIVIL